MTDRLTPIQAALEARKAAGKRTVLAIDGMAAAGKSTAAEALSRHWNAPVVHMDDFFLPSELRTTERLAEPGGNVHYERFAAEVLPHLAAGEAFSYRAFRCSTMTFDDIKMITAAPLVIVEGAYAMHPIFGDYADLTVFFSIGTEEQQHRILARDGEDGWEAFHTRWIPMENAYHAAFHTRERADILL